jgi:hypothetical protein
MELPISYNSREVTSALVARTGPVARTLDGRLAA